MLRESQNNYQNTVQMAKRNYFAEVITKNSSKPQVLFNIVNSVFNLKSDVLFHLPPITCETFFGLFCPKDFGQ